MLSPSSEMINVIKANTDAFMAISKIAFSSVEQLTTLNLSTTRNSLEEGASASASMFESNGAVPSSKAKKANPLAVSESAGSYFRSVQNIATEAREDVTKLMTTYFASQGNASSWLKGFDAFNGVAQQFSALEEANRKVMTDVTTQVVNQTKLDSRKSA